MRGLVSTIYVRPQTSKGRRRLKTNTELLDEIKPHLAAVPTPTQIAGLTGLTLET